MKTALLIYNPQCSKCRGADQILKEKNIPFEEILYLNGELTPELLEKLPKLLKLPYEAMIRKGEDLYEQLRLENKKLSDKEWGELILKHPILLERPIFIYGDEAVIARPSELVNKLL